MTLGALILADGGLADKLYWAFPLAILAIVVFLFLRFSRKRLIARLSKEEEPQRARGGGGSALASGPASASGGISEIQRLFVEIHDFAREVEGRLDTKIAYLRRLLDEAEAVTRKLGQLLEAAGGSKEPGGLPTSKPPEPAPAEAVPAGAGAGKAVDLVVGEPPREAASPQLRGRILELHQAGRNVPEIVQAVGLPKGEVELIINLHQSASGDKP